MLFLRALVGVVISVCFLLSALSFAIKYPKVTTEGNPTERDERQGSYASSPLSVPGSPSSGASSDSGVQMDSEGDPASSQHVVESQIDIIAKLPIELNVLLSQILMEGNLNHFERVYNLREVSQSWRNFVDSNIHVIVNPCPWCFGSGKGYLGSAALGSLMMRL